MENKPNVLKRLDCIIATFLMLCVFVDVMLQITSRLTPGNAISWTVEMGEILLAGIIWMGIGLGVLNNNHIRFDILLSGLPHRPKKILYVVGNIFFAVFLLILAFYAIELLAFYIKTNTKTPSLRWNKAIIRAPVLIGCIVGTIRFLMQAWYYGTEKMPLPGGSTGTDISVIIEDIQSEGGKK